MYNYIDNVIISELIDNLSFYMTVSGPLIP